MKWVNENYLNDNINYSYKLSLLSDLVKILGITVYYTLVPLIFKSTYGKKKKSLVIINGSTQKPANVFQLFMKLHSFMFYYHRTIIISTYIKKLTNLNLPINKKLFQIIFFHFLCKLNFFFFKILILRANQILNSF